MPAYGVRRPVVLSPFLLRVVSAVLAFLANAAARMAVVRPDARLNCGPHPRAALAWAFEWVVVKTCVQGGANWGGDGGLTLTVSGSAMKN